MVAIGVIFQADLGRDLIQRELKKLGLSEGLLDSDYRFKIVGSGSNRLVLITVPDTGQNDYLGALAGTVKGITALEILPVSLIGDIINSLEKAPA